MFEKLAGYDEAARLVEKNMSPRAKRLAELERWVDGTQYAGKLDWFADAAIADKAPCIVEPVIADSIESHVDMVLGEGRFPVITTRPAEDDEDDETEEGSGDDDEGGLSEEDSDAFDTLICGLIECARFKPLCREALSAAMGCGSACAIYGIRDAKLFGDTVKARWCEPEFLPDQRTVSRLVIQYPYVESYQEGGVWKARARIFRRVIDDKTDTTYLPADAGNDKIVWQVAPGGAIPHGLGFCPVVWYALFRGSTIVGQFDGHAPHENLTDEVYAHDVALSQRHRAALYAGDPQWTEAGVEPGENPSAGAVDRGTPMTQSGGAITGDNPVVGRVGGDGARRGGSRKKHPGTVWQYEDKEVNVQLHTLPGDALKALSDHAHDLRLKIMQALAYVPLDPESSAGIIRGTLSGKALDALRERQLNRDDRIREDFGDGFLKPSVSMMARICAVRGDGLRVRGLKSAAKVLQRFTGTDQAATDAVA